MMASPPGYSVQNEIRIVAIGHTGDGKSSTCNSILQKEKAFEARLQASSVTQECSDAQAVVLGKSVSVVDTPGFFDTHKSIEITSTEVGKCLLKCSPGPHAFIYVVPIGSRFSKEYIDTLDTVENLFGERCTDYMIVLFTHADSFEAGGQSIDVQLDAYIREGPSPNVVKELVEKCGNRSIAFNNKLKKNSEENAAQVNALFEMVDMVVKLNKDKGPCYTSELLDAAEKVMKKKDDEIKAKLQRKKDKDYDSKMKNVRNESRSEVGEILASWFWGFLNVVKEVLTKFPPPDSETQTKLDLGL